MLRKSKSLSAFAAALLATATVAQPVAAQVAAQANESWYTQGGYDTNAPYPPYPYGDDASADPYGQNYDQGDGQYDYGAPNTGYDDGSDGQYGAAPGESDYDAEAAERDQAAQAWRDRYAAPPQQDYGYGPPDDGYGPPGYGPPSYAAPPPPDYGYQQSYYDDDYYRRACQRQRANNQVGGLVFGAILGGLFGNAVSGRHHRGGATAAGAIMGGTLGLALASNLDCEDRYYAQTAYYDGFEAGYPNRTYRWRNPRSGNYGAMRVGEYYRDPYGRRCTTYSQTIWVRGRPEEATGFACRRFDGTWEIIS